MRASASCRGITPATCTTSASTPTGPFHLPPGGDATSLRIAWITHQLVVHWRRGGQRPSGQALGQRFGFSRSTWSRIARGTRWPGEAGFVTLVYASRVNRPDTYRQAPPPSKAN